MASHSAALIVLDLGRRTGSGTFDQDRAVPMMGRPHRLWRVRARAAWDLCL